MNLSLICPVDSSPTRHDVLLVLATDRLGGAGRAEHLHETPNLSNDFGG